MATKNVSVQPGTSHQLEGSLDGDGTLSREGLDEVSPSEVSTGGALRNRNAGNGVVAYHCTDGGMCVMYPRSSEMDEVEPGVHDRLANEGNLLGV
jgi:hypothetical protein